MKNKNIELVVEFIISAILVKLGIALFEFKNNSVCVVIAVGILMFLLRRIKDKYKEIKCKKTIIISAIYSLAISIAIMLQSKITFNENVGLSYLENTFEAFKILDILKVIVLFIIVFIIILNLMSWIKNTKFSILNDDEKSENKIKNNKIILNWIIATILVAIPYILYLLTYAPGAVLGDSLNSISQGLGYSKFTNHHPVLYSIYVGIFMRIGKTLNNYNLGVMLYSIVQLLIMSGIIGYFLVWLKKHNVKSKYIFLTYLYFIANTVFSSYAIIMWKDPLFSGFIFLMVIYLFDIIKQNGKQLKTIRGILKFIILDILIAFFRNNGIYIVLGICLTLLLLFKKRLLKFNIINVIIVIVILIIQGPIYKKLGIVSPIEESMSIPLQQIARTIAYDGQITDEQKEFLDKILPIEKWKEKYEPCLVDSIKWDENFDSDFLENNKGQFLKIWASMLPNNFVEYIKAYLFDTYGFWSIETKNNYGFVDTYISPNNYDINEKDYIEIFTGKSMKNYFSTPDFLGTGTLLWIMLLSIVILAVNKNDKYIICLLPCLFAWATIMIATPVAFSLRYLFILAYALPFMIMLPFLNKTNSLINEKNK